MSLVVPRDGAVRDPCLAERLDMWVDDEGLCITEPDRHAPDAGLGALASAQRSQGRWTRGTEREGGGGVRSSASGTSLGSLPMPLGRVVLAAPHQPTRVALARTLQTAGGIEALVALGSYRAVAGHAARSRADVALLALHGVAPAGAGLVAELAAVASELAGLAAPPEVIVVAARPPAGRTVRALTAAGIAGLVVWPYPAPELAMTVRQHQLLGTVAGGCSNATIAARLGIGVASVSTELQRLYRKLGVTGRASACTRAFHTGLLI